jgi:hypothetical protein
MGMHHLELPVSYALYGAAALGSLATITIVLAL